MTEQELNNKFGIHGIPIKPGKLLIGVNSHTNTTWRNVKFSLDQEEFEQVLDKQDIKIKTKEIKVTYNNLKNAIKPFPTTQNIENFQLAICLLVWKNIADYWQHVSTADGDDLERPKILKTCKGPYPEIKILAGFDDVQGLMAQPSKNNLQTFENKIERNLATMKNTVNRLKPDSGESADVKTRKEKVAEHQKLYANGSSPELEEIKKQMREVENNSNLSPKEKDAQLKKLRDKFNGNGNVVDDNTSEKVKELYRSYLKSLNKYIPNAPDESAVEAHSKKKAATKLTELEKLDSKNGLVKRAIAYFEELAGVNNRAYDGPLSKFLSDNGRHSDFLKSVNPAAKNALNLDNDTVARLINKKFGSGQVLNGKNIEGKDPKTQLQRELKAKMKAKNGS